MKLLVVRFSSIGDIVLTTPVIRCVKKQMPNVTVHYLTKSKFCSILEDNPYIDKLWTIERSISEIITALKKEQYDWMIDLHHNVRTFSLKLQLRVPSSAFQKLNVKKWQLVTLKINKLPEKHIVDRYFETVKRWNVVSDFLPCDFYINTKAKIARSTLFKNELDFIALFIGAQFATKRVNFEKWVEIIEQLDQPLVFFGNEMDGVLAEKIIRYFPGKSLFNTCGKFSLQASASLIQQSKLIVSNDTGLMHIASCFEIPIVSLWCSTVPSFGMFPYQPKNKALYKIHQVDGLSCRPCSKIGFQKCPKQHFKCVNLLNTTEIVRVSKRIGKVIIKRLYMVIKREKLDNVVFFLFLVDHLINSVLTKVVNEGELKFNARNYDCK